MESERDMTARLSTGSELQSNETFSDESFNHLSLTEEIDSSFGGAFDGAIIPSVHEIKDEENVALKNAMARSDKRFEFAMGMNMVRADGFQFKPVRHEIYMRCNNIGVFTTALKIAISLNS